jgi:hypothetical protein
VVASLVVFTIIAVVRLSSRQAPIARGLLQSALLPVLLAMLAALVATLAKRR